MSNKTTAEQLDELERSLKAFGNVVADTWLVPIVKFLTRLLAKVGVTW